MKLYIIQTKVTRMIVTATVDLEKAQATLVSNLAINPAYIGPGLTWDHPDDFQDEIRTCTNIDAFLTLHRKKCGLEIVECSVDLSMPEVEDPEKLQRAMFEVEDMLTEQGCHGTPLCFQSVAAAIHHFTGGKVSI